MGGKSTRVRRRRIDLPEVKTNTASREASYKTMFVGDANTGKTCTLIRIADDIFSSIYLPTIGIDFKVRSFNIDGVKLKLYLWDTAGQERFRTITLAYYRGTDGFIVFYDATRQCTFHNVKYWLMEVRKYGPPGAPVIVVGTKADLLNKKVVDYEVAKDFCDVNDVPLIEVSAKDGTNTALALVTLIAMIRDRQTEN